MWRRTRQWLIVVLWLTVFGCRGCSGCGGAIAIATLESTQGRVERDHSAELKQWEPAELGAKFHLGDGVQTHSEATAQLRLRDGSQLLMKPDTLIRFSRTAPENEQVAFDVELGVASLKAGAQPLSVLMNLGAVRIEAGAQVVMSRSDEGLELILELGQAVFVDTRLSAGESILIDIGGVVIETAVARAQAERARRAVELVITGQNAGILGESGWTKLGEGSSQVDPGTELRLGKETRAVVGRGKQQATLTDAGLYRIAPAQGVLVSTEQGKVTAGGASLVRIQVPGGVLVVAPLGRAELEVSPGKTAVALRRASAQLVTGTRTISLGVGQSAQLSADGEITTNGVGLNFADYELKAGETVVIHDPAPPTAIRISFTGDCPGSGAVRVKQGKKPLGYAAGKDRVSMSFQAGSVDYRLRCLDAEGVPDEVVQRGTIRVIADRGSRAIGVRAPITKLQADGRSYTVLYQNRLPSVEFTWRAAPTSEEFQLVHSFLKRKKTMTVFRPTYRFKSGQLREGKHVLHFEAEGKLSRRTTIQVAFDNAAPTASLRTPPVVEVAQGQEVVLAGIALPGSTVSVFGKKIWTDRQGRFSSSVVFPSDRRALAVSIHHPRRGAHVYLRRGRTP